MPTLQQTVDEATKVLAQTKEQGSKPFKGSSFDTPIPYSTLTSKDTPAEVATPPVPTQAAGFSAGMETMANQNKDAYTQNLANNAETAKTNADSSFEEYMKSVLGSDGKTSLTDKAYRGTVDPAQSELNDINNQIIAEQVALRRRVEKAQKENPLGKSAEGIQDQVDQINRESISKQADLAVIQLSKQGKYDSAKAIADRAVSAQFEQQQVKNEALKLNYERNKDLFTTAEQRQFETAQADRNRALDFEIYKEKARYDQTIKQNDPLYKAQLAQLDTGTVDITNPSAVAYGTALNTILASAKFTKEQKADLVRGINSGEDPFTVVKNQAKNIMGQTEATQLTKYEVARDTLSDIGTQLKEFYDAGGKTDIISGNFEKVINNLGNVKDPKLVALATQIQGNLQVYRNAISGTAYSAQEGRDISSIFPGINKSASLNTAILTGRSTLFDSIIDSTYSSAIGKDTYSALKTAEEKGVKGNQDDKTFVESTLSKIGASYDTVIKDVPAGKKAVIDNKTGQVGYIDEGEYDPKLYTSL